MGLAIGMPGQSNALAIAKRLGLPGTIVNSARALLDPNAIRTENYLSEIDGLTVGEAERRLSSGKDDIA